MTPARDPAALPFDEVLLLGPPERRISNVEFFQLSLPQRLRHVIGRTAVFLRGGEVVDAQAALAQVRSTVAAAAPAA